MPHHSSRSRGHGRDYDRDHQTRHYERQPLRHDDDDDVFDDRPHRSSRAHVPTSHRDRHRHSRTRYDDNERYEEDEDEEDDDEDEDEDDDDEKAEQEPLVVDSRPKFARPPNPRSSGPVPPLEVGRRRDRESVRMVRGEKAKESPATSPVKKRDRERDREGRRRRESVGNGGDSSPAKGGRVRDRRHRENRDRERERERRRDRDHERAREKKHNSTDSANSTAQLLSVDSLAKLDAKNRRAAAVQREKDAKEEKANAKKEKERSRRREQPLFAPKVRGGGGGKGEFDEKAWKKKSGGKRMVSGAILEEGRGARRRSGKKESRWFFKSGGGGGDDDEEGSRDAERRKKKKWFWIGLGVLASLLAIIIPVGVVISKKGGDDSDSSQSSPSTSGAPSNEELKSIDPDSIPSDAKGTILDPFIWYDTTDFNVTYTSETVGGLSVMGLNSEWDDSAQANEHVPPLNEEFPYGDQPIRGVNVGGWLSIEPFITPSFFSDYSSGDDVVDEYTLTSRLGSQATQMLEEHYASFITEQDFKEIKDAGIDHVRIPFSYWAVKTYDGDPYVPKVSWRYLLRGIEYCRKYGLRVKLDIHGLPGSQNGWNHSGRQGDIGWLYGPDGEKNAKRAMEMHDQLSQFFAQDRYKNVVTIYGLCNEPKMIDLDVRPVLDWTTEAVEMIRKNGMKQLVAFGDGFLLLSKWKTMLQDVDDKMLLDTHQYTIFNIAQIGLPHDEKLDLVCNDWVPMLRASSTKGTGWGPTICGEWSQADTDCAEYLNNVNSGNRWTGTMDSFSSEPNCPTAPKCDCDNANADPSTYSDEYKRFLKTFAEAQMAAFEAAWGWFYWTWKTESAVQWSWKLGLEAGILPEKAYEPDFKCDGDVPDIEGLPEDY